MIRETPPGRMRGALGVSTERLAMLWAGVALGVSFLATPVKFLAPSLTLPVALDVGRHTFRALNQVEIALGLTLAALGLGSRPGGSRIVLLLAPLAVVALQGVWLLPLLDGRVQQVLDGGAPPRSSLHALYIGSELVKVAALLAIGLALARGSVGRWR